MKIIKAGFKTNFPKFGLQFELVRFGVCWEQHWSGIKPIVFRPAVDGQGYNGGTLWLYKIGFALGFRSGVRGHRYQ